MPDPSEQHRREEWLTELQSSGYRVTAPRRAVVEVMAASDRALSASEIYDQARRHEPSHGLVSVYRTLEKLEELHLIQRVHGPDGCHAYISGFTGHQHRLVCEGCGRVKFFRGDDLQGLIARVQQETGFEVKEHWLQLFGVCEGCRP